MTSVQMPYEIVIPTIGRPCLGLLLDALARQESLPGRVVVVDDRDPAAAAAAPLLLHSSSSLPVLVHGSGGRGPAAARNVGWRATSAPWVVFLDDDVITPPEWSAALQEDIGAAPDVGASCGRIVVPLPADRRPTDWERNTAGLAHARWATADMAYRRTALEATGGFDPNFPRAYREDADLGLRTVEAGFAIERGRRHVIHPVRPTGRYISLRLQRGNADDARMRALHGPRWRELTGAGRGRFALHLATTAAGMASCSAALAGRRRAAAVAALAWLGATAHFAWSRIAPGPRTPVEVADMVATSVAIPPAAVWHRARGTVHARGARSPVPERAVPVRRAVPVAVLFDRDGTLVHDVPYNGDPAQVTPMPRARLALDRLRGAGVPIAVVSNQSGVGRGLITAQQVDAVNRRIEELLGPLGPWFLCLHAPEDQCTCRKPAPGLVLAAAEALGVEPQRCALIGDIGADVEAARAAGARGVLVPTDRTLAAEVMNAPEVAPDIGTAVDLLLGPGERT